MKLFNNTKGDFSQRSERKIQEGGGRGDKARITAGREKDRGGERESGRDATREITPPYTFKKNHSYYSPEEFDLQSMGP